jgi:hypothetical protein
LGDIPPVAHISVLGNPPLVERQFVELGTVRQGGQSHTYDKSDKGLVPLSDFCG